MHRQARERRQWPVIVPPADARHQQQSRGKHRERRRGRRGQDADAQAGQQLRGDDGDATTTRCRDCMAPALPGLVQQLPAQRIATRQRRQQRRNNEDR